ncbi:ketoacyl-ACP synthase III [Pseudoalteromonas aurantia]|jgi:3-oxoacyl-(acyl-carrier-protein) synthase III|uniref:Ketoacyl-ACP synthase III n=1 Tax=Pseudoalteromonas aurantia TaxID=43654 RepID=A0A5S3VE97_9GAMM|nr:ketoacyl-ACP synthase III [Pseudoalteromonas aurantia]TMO65875.1 ketoacyl-ACP synthase III [Pseudoalteromonas aurantia]TMO70709.1 ketoacyl-ACP synthase III [Pseudoalteromonas aurantia]
MSQSYIVGTGYYLPENKVDNHDIAKRINTSDDFIRTRIGVKTRFHAQPTQSCSDLMLAAAKMAISQANVQLEDIDMLIVNTLSPDIHDPSQACVLADKLGLSEVAAFDIRAQCSGLLYGINIAKNFIVAKERRCVLVVAGELLSKRIDTSDAGRNLAVMLGDGSGAVVVSDTADSERQCGELVDMVISADGRQWQSLVTRVPGSAQRQFHQADDGDDGHSFMRMNGPNVFEHGVTKFCEIAHTILMRNQLKVADIDKFIVHQPNLRMLEEIQHKLDIDPQKMPINVTDYGNMASASTAVTLAQSCQSGVIQKGDWVLILSYGAGATWAGALVKF